MIDRKSRMSNDEYFHAMERNHSSVLSAQIDSIEEIKKLIASGQKKEAAMAIAVLREMLATKSKIVGAIDQITGSNLTGTNKRKH